VSLYPEPLRSLLTVVVPVAFATTVPAQALTGQLHPQMFVAALASASGLLVVSRLVWLRGLRHYSGASA